MTWAKFDDGIYDHPKVIEAGRDARELFFASIVYSSRHLTDGVIPRGALRILQAWTEIDDTAACADRLIEVGLWEVHEDGYRIGDYMGCDWIVEDVAYLRNQWNEQRAALAPIILERDGAVCHYCGATDDLTIDHITPLARGGSNKPANLAVACRACNSSKGTRRLEDWQR